MDETYFVYGDDIDWCWRFMKAGWKVLFAPVAEIVHYGGQTTRQAPGKFALQLYGAYLINVKKHYPARTFLAARVLMAWYFLMRGFHWSFRALIPGDQRMKGLEAARTFYRGVYYCLCDWKGMLMNREEVERRLRHHDARVIAAQNRP